MRNKAFLAYFIIFCIVATIFVSTNTFTNLVGAAPSIGTNINVTSNSLGQNEPNIAVNPLHNKLQPLDIHVAVGANDYRSGTGKTIAGLYTSTDLTTWNYHSVSTPSYDSYGNPALAYDSLGNLYYAYMAWHIDSNGYKHDGTIYVSKSTTEGLNWAFYTRVSGLGSGDDPFCDRPWIAIDQSNNYIYVSWTVWHGLSQGVLTTSGSDIMFAVSKDGGQSFSAPKLISSSYLPSNLQRQWSNIAVGPSGEVYVTWRRLGFGNPVPTRAILMVKSTDQGASFGSESLVVQYPDFYSADWQSNNDPPATSTWPKLAVGPEGNLYIVWHGYVGAGDRDIYFIKSGDDGVSWSTQKTIASTTSDQFWPEIAVAANGRVDVVWYDRHDDSNNHLLNLYYASSSDKGVTFGSAVKVTTASSDPSVPATDSVLYFGDTICMAETGDGATLPVWTDTRDGNQEIYFAACTSNPSPTPGDYIVTEIGTNQLSLVSPSGSRNVISSFASNTDPEGVAIDSAGNYIVTEINTDKLSLISPNGVRTVIYSFAANTHPASVVKDASGNYIVTEMGTNKLSMISPSGLRTEICSFAANTGLYGVAIDSAGNYIVTEHYTGKLSKVTPSGVRTEIYSFATTAGPQGVTINAAGNYIVAESASGKLSMVTPGGVRTEIYTFAAGAYPSGVAVDGAGNYIVVEHLAEKLSKVTPSGVRTEIFSFATGTSPQGIAIMPGAWSTYSATIWSWDILGWQSVPITMDGAPTGFSTPHTFTGLSGIHTFTVPSTDSNGYPFCDWYTGEKAPTITVSTDGIYTARYAPTLTCSVTPSTWVMDVGQSKQFTATASGGNGTYLGYQWYIGGIAVSGQTAQTFNYTPSSAGSPVITATVTDGMGVTSPIQTQSPAVTVNSALSTPSVSASVGTVVQGQSSTLLATGLSGGTTPYNYQWLQKAPGAGDYSAISGAISSGYVFSTSSSTATGIWSFELNFTDSASSPVTVTSSAATVTVNSAGTAPTVSVSPSSWVMDADQLNLFTASASGGSGSYSSYQWYVGGVAKSGATASTFNFAPGSAGSYSITATVTDSLGSTSPPSSAASVTVNSVIILNVSPASWTMNVGQSKQFTAVASGGTGSLGYQWYLGSSPISGQTSTTYTYTPSATGSYAIYCRVSDSASSPDVVQSSANSVAVNSALVAPVASASLGTVDQGQSSSLTIPAVATGTSPYTYQWYSSVGSGAYSIISGATISSYNFVTSSSTATGSWSFKLQVTDSSGASVNSSVATVTVNIPSVTTPPPAVTPTPPTVTTSPPTVTTAPPTVTTAPPKVTTAPPTVTTSPPTSTAEASGGTYDLFIIAVVVVILVAITAATIVMVKRKSK